MVVRELYAVRDDGVKLYRVYSDSGFFIERDGIMYEEAIDPDGFDREYAETCDPIPPRVLSPEEALLIITGESFITEQEADEIRDALISYRAETQDEQAVINQA